MWITTDSGDIVNTEYGEYIYKANAGSAGTFVNIFLTQRGAVTVKENFPTVADADKFIDAIKRFANGGCWKDDE